MTLRGTILIVEDEPGLRLTLEEMLTNDGHTVATVANGHNALELIRTEPFDLVLLDIQLGDMEGTDVLAALQEETPQTLAIMLTAYASLETAVASLRYGAHDYLYKPFSREKLQKSIERALCKLKQRNENHENLPAGSTPVPIIMEEKGRFMHYKSLIVDNSHRIIILESHLLELSPTEFELMAYMIQEAPRPISPQELVSKVHGYELEAWQASETVRSHIYHIRQKIKKTTGRTDVIRTIRSVGYAIP